MADVLTPEQRHRNMQSIKGKDTSIEITLRKALWREGIRYRKNYKGLPGKPNVVLTKYKIAIFCDSEFFHGKDWSELKAKLCSSHNGDFWIKKITRNIERDEEVNSLLNSMGWTVVRFWGKDIKNSPSDCVSTIKELIRSRKT